MGTYQNLIVEIEEEIAYITINRPKKLNALNIITIKELHLCLKELRNNEEVRVVLITGSGEKAFIAGADILEFADFTAEQGMQLSERGQELLFNFIEEFPKPIIAVINGFALGGGLELAMACHLRIASENAKMGFPETSLGLIPGYGGTQRLPQLIGKGRAMEMILSAKMISAEQAFQYGLVNHITSQEELVDLAEKIACQLLQNSLQAIAKAITAINAGFQIDKNGFETEIESFGNCFATDDFKEGISAFLEKRKPEF